MFTDRRLWIVLMLGALVAGASVYRLQTNQPYDYDALVKASSIGAPAPLFEGTDENNQMFRLSAFAGRHRIVVVFFDGAVGADRSAALLTLRDRAEELKRLDVKVAGVSQAIPQENRAALASLGEFPGPLISDVDGTIHRKWQRLSADGRTVPGVFLIDRKGSVAFQAGAPRSYESVEELWKDLRT